MTTTAEIHVSMTADPPDQSEKLISADMDMETEPATVEPEHQPPALVETEPQAPALVEPEHQAPELEPDLAFIIQPDPGLCKIIFLLVLIDVMFNLL